MQLFDSLELVRRGGNSILKEACTKVLAGSNRERLREELKKQQQELDLVSKHFSDFVVETLDEFAEEHPTQLKWLTTGLLAAAVVRPVISILCVGVPVQEIVAEGASQAVVECAIASGVQVGAEAGGSLAVSTLLNKIFSKFYEIRMDCLIKVIDQHTIAPMVKELNRFADYPNTKSFLELRETTTTLNDQCNDFRETK
jgi:hypothetical protein